VALCELAGGRFRAEHALVADLEGGAVALDRVRRLVPHLAVWVRPPWSKTENREHLPTSRLRLLDHLADLALGDLSCHHPRLLCSDGLLVSDRGMDRWHLGLAAAHPLSKHVDALRFILRSVRFELVVAGVDVGALSRASNRYVGALPGGVLAEDHMRGVSRAPLGRERMLHIGQTDIGTVDLRAFQLDIATVCQL
jgi:hypothetical protein